MIVGQALKYRDNVGRANNETSQVLGYWGSIIDAVKIVLVKKRDEAAKNFQLLIQFGMKGEPTLVQNYLRKLH
jgi:hypothetical protein